MRFAFARPIRQYLPLGRRPLSVSLRRKIHRQPSPSVAGVTVSSASANPVGRLVATKEAIHIADLVAEQPYIERDPVSSPPLNLAVSRTILAVPMLKENELIGYFISTAKKFALYRQADRTRHRTSPLKPSSPSRTRGCSTNCASAPPTSLNAQPTSRKPWSSRRPRRRCSRLSSSSPGDLEPVFATMLEKAVRICDAKFGNIYRWDGEFLHLLAAHDTPPALRRISPTFSASTLAHPSHGGDQDGHPRYRCCGRPGVP